MERWDGPEPTRKIGKFFEDFYRLIFTAQTSAKNDLCNVFIYKKSALYSGKV